MARLNSNIIVSERLEKRLNKSLEEVQQEIFRLVDRLTRQFKQENGVYVPDDQAGELLATLNREIRRILERSSLTDEMMKFLDDFDLLDANIKAIQSDLNGIKVPADIFTNQKKWAMDSVVNALREGNVNLKFIQPVKDILYSRVAFGGSVTDAEKQLRRVILGSGEENGAIIKSIGQVARDTMQQYQGTVNQQIKVEYGLTNIRYVGPLVKDSRDQCIRWIEKFDGLLRDDQLEDEIRWAYNNGQGMYPDTTPENFCQKRGGYNCIHDAIPVRAKK